MKKFKYFNLVDIAIVLAIVLAIVVILWYSAPTFINTIFNIGKDFGQALAKWF
ncbi:hypothetical protein ABPS01_08705 [Streptococcus sp. ZJ151]|uniref:hypothetical protein n=1 Tax=Streptococcus jiangjianxini TaxID=3161189 RepID=UPI0032EBEADD